MSIPEDTTTCWLSGFYHSVSRDQYRNASKLRRYAKLCPYYVSNPVIVKVMSPYHLPYTAK